MGVQGFYSYIDRNDNLLKDVKLRNTALIIDGSGLMYKLAFSPILDQQHGGDYSAFADIIGDFIEALLICKIQPFVVLDGGMDYSDKKFETLCKRACGKMTEAHAISTGKPGTVLPLLAKDVFKQVLSSLGVPFVQCVAEADWEIAALANEWNCPVLTTDSDFYIFELKAGCLPMQHFQWNKLTECKETSRKFIPAKCYSVDIFCRHYNINKDLLPLFATMCGNDWVNSKTMENFFRRVKFPKNPMNFLSSNHEKIDNLLHWLSGFPGLEEALDKVLMIIEGDGGQDAVLFLYLLSSGIREYKLSTSNVSGYFLNKGVLPSLPKHIRIFPDWICWAMIEGKLSGFLISVLVMGKVVLKMQIENKCQPSSHTTSLPIRQVLYGLLLHQKDAWSRMQADRKQHLLNPQTPTRAIRVKSQFHVEEYCRQYLNLRSTSVPAVLPKCLQSLPQLSLESFEKTPWPVRLQVLLETLGVQRAILSVAPPHFSLPVCITCYWLSHCEPRPLQLHLQALLLGMVYGELSRSVGRLKGCPALLLVCRNLDYARIGWEENGPHPEVTHLYNQWQSSMMYGLNLNQLLCCPLPKPTCARLYSGTLVHGLVRKLTAGDTPQSLLQGSPIHIQLFDDLQRAVLSSVKPNFFSEGRRKTEQIQRKSLPEKQRSNRSAMQELSNRFAALSCSYDGEEDNDDYQNPSLGAHQTRVRHRTNHGKKQDREYY